MKSKCYGRSGTIVNCYKCKCKCEISKNCTDIPKRKVVAVVIDSYKRILKSLESLKFKI